MHIKLFVLNSQDSWDVDVPYNVYFGHNVLHNSYANIVQGSFCVFSQPMGDDVTL